MSRSDPVAAFIAQLRRQLPPSVPGRRRLLKESEEHLDYAVAELTSQGVPRDEAQRIAIQRFGSPEAFVRGAGYSPRSIVSDAAPAPRRAAKMTSPAAPVPARKYPPLAFAGLVAVLLLAALPSALTLPDSNPTQTLEYAPVPPEQDEVITPATGSFSSLGIGRSAGLITNQTPGAAEGGEAGGGRPIKSPTTKRCVGNPPRQTEDVGSPPCVSTFLGDNGGATYQGVTSDEIRILLHIDGSYNDGGSRGIQGRPNGKLFDLAEPLPEEDNQGIYWLEAARIWQRYFNERYQTYGRFAHFYVSFGTGPTPEARRADAANDFNRVRPFAVVVQDAPSQTGPPYVEVMTSKGVLAFGIRSQLPQELFQKFSGKLWTYWPSLELQARQFTDYLCTKLVPHPVSYTGNDSDPDQRLHNGQPRRLGLLWVDNPVDPNKKRFSALVREGVVGCGGRIVAEGSLPRSGTLCCGNSESAARHLARFRAEGVTTIIWPQGFSPEVSHAAGKQAYFPEWILAGDRLQEDIVAAKYQDPNVWRRVVVVTNVALAGPLRNQICYQAVREQEPDHPATDFAIPCRLYDDLRQLFIGIQVAGPNLRPASVEKGFRAIPNRPSGSPEVPACFYAVGDYTCVKDSIAQYWDPEARSTFSSSTGCYRVPRSGQRFLAGGWDDTDVIAERGPDDPCNGWTSGQAADPSPGPDAPLPQ